MKECTIQKKTPFVYIYKSKMSINCSRFMFNSYFVCPESTEISNMKAVFVLSMRVCM